jgi:DNA polymerase III sliding clamp (beta) subunit (PCNA family)
MSQKIETFAKVVVDSKELKNALGFVKHSLNKNSIGYTDSCFFFEFGMDGLTLVASDFRSSTRTILETQVIDGLNAGNIYLSNAILSFIGLVDHQPITIELCGKLTSVASELLKYIKVTTDTGVYQFESPVPHIVESNYKVFENKKVVCQIHSYELLDGFAFASAAKKQDNSDEEIKGNVCLRLTKKKFSVTATDGFRIHRYSSKHDSDEVKEGTYLIDGKAVTILTNFLKRNGDSVVSIKTADNFFILLNEKDEILIRLYDAKYPDTDSIYSKLTPAEYKTTITANIQHLKATLSRIGIFKDELKQCKVVIQPEHGGIEVCDLQGKSREVVVADVSAGASEMEIRFNIDHFQNALNVIDGEEVLIRLKDDKSFAHLTNIGFEFKEDALLVPFQNIERV